MGEVRQKIRGTSVELDASLGLEGLVAYNITTHELRVYDGLTLGGYQILNRQNTIALIASSAVVAYDAARLGGQLPAYYAKSAQQIIAGVGMTGGGTLAADRTISMGTPGTLTGATTNSVTGTTHTHDITLGVADIANAVPDTRQVIAGVGMTGGGTLLADRTLTLGTPSSITGATTNSVSGTTHTHAISLSSANIISFLGYTPANNAQQVIAGAGMTGGGTLAADRTLALGTPNTITTSSTNSVSGTTHTHALTLTGANLNTIYGFSPADNLRIITAGVGLSGGGNLTADRTISMGTPSDITNSTTNSASGTTHTHALGFEAAEVYQGAGAGDTAFPTGHVVTMHIQPSIPARNALITVYLATSLAASVSYTSLNTEGTALAGTWRFRGAVNYTGSAFIGLAQRVS